MTENKSNGFLGSVELLDTGGLEKRILKHIYASARNCYDPKGPAYFFQIAEEMYNDEAKKQKLIDFCLTLIQKKHRTTLTHSMFSFSILNASRSCVDQMRTQQVGANFDVMSQRYIKFCRNDELLEMTWNLHLNNEEYQQNLSPETIRKIDRFQFLQKELYQDLVADGKPAEEARWVLSMDMPTNLMASYNIVSFKHFLDTRLKHSTGKSQSEIESLALEMRKELIFHVPFLKSVYE